MKFLIYPQEEIIYAKCRNNCDNCDDCGVDCNQFGFDCFLQCFR